MLPPLPLDKKSLAHRYLPVTEWMPGYQRSWLTGDVLAGLTIWALLVPEALAYAGIAGVPVQYGLYCAPLALIAYAIFGGSKRLVVGPSSTVAIVSASVVAPLAASGSSDRYLALTIALALMTGIVLVVAGLSKLGFVAKFLAKPVLDGFIIGLAFTIAIGQAGKLVGVHTSGDTALQKTVSIFSQIGKWSWVPLLVGGLCLALMFILEKYLPRIPAAIIAVILTTLAAYVFNLGAHGLTLVGKIPGGLPAWGLKGLGLEDLYHLIPGALSVALVGFTESIAVAKDDAVRHDYEVDANQEMVANGMANIGAGLFQSFAVNGSLSKSAACEASGGNTQVAGSITALLTFATILFLTPLFTYLPEATLGAIVIHALWKYFSPKGMTRLYHVRKGDFVLAAAALVGVFFFGVLPGIVAGVVLSLALLIQRASSPNSAVLGMKPGGGRFADITKNPDYETFPGLIIYRYDAPLVFPNAERFLHEVRALVNAADPPARCVIVDFEVMSDMDTTASDQFSDLLTIFDANHVEVKIARLHTPVRQFMEKDGLIAKIGEDNIYPRVMDAVEAFKAEGPSEDSGQGGKSVT